MANDDLIGASHDLSSLLSSDGRDYLIRNDGDQVKISSLLGKIVALYFSGSWCRPCQKFTPSLVDVYQALSPQVDFEVVFISSDRDDESFNAYYSKMPWLAIPFTDDGARKRLKELFSVRGIPHLVVLDGNGKVTTDQGVRIVLEHGEEGYPFTLEQLAFLKEQQENLKKNQTLSSVLVSKSRDYVISSDGTKIPVSDLEGKMVGLYFYIHARPMSAEFTPKLVEVYKKLKERGESFEVVLVPLDNEEEGFKGFETMPWLSLPFRDRTSEKLASYFELKTLPTVVMIGQDGKTLNPNVADLIEDHGIEAYPFSPEKLAELAEIDKARLEAQTLESLLVQEDKDYVIGKTGSKIPVSELVGKNILLYFSAQWCPPCRAFLPKLIEVYQEIKAKDNDFEIIFMSSDRDQSSYDEFYSGMPWLALPFGDKRKGTLHRKFKIQGIPAAVAIGPSGKTITTEARKHLANYGADAYPFTEEHLKILEEKFEEMAKEWPEKVMHQLHLDHELIRVKRSGYVCDGCKNSGNGWSFYCKKCDFDLHPKCALKENEMNGPAKEKDGWVCDGDVCKKA